MELTPADFKKGRPFPKSSAPKKPAREMRWVKEGEIDEQLIKDIAAGLKITEEAALEFYKKTQLIRKRPILTDEDSEDEPTYLTNQQVADYFSAHLASSNIPQEFLQLIDPNKIDLFIKIRGKKLKYLKQHVQQLQLLVPTQKAAIDIIRKAMFDNGLPSWEVVVKYNKDGSERGIVRQERSAYITDHFDQLLSSALRQKLKALGKQYNVPKENLSVDIPQ